MHVGRIISTSSIVMICILYSCHIKTCNVILCYLLIWFNIMSQKMWCVSLFHSSTVEKFHIVCVCIFYLSTYSLINIYVIFTPYLMWLIQQKTLIDIFLWICFNYSWVYIQEGYMSYIKIQYFICYLDSIWVF